MSGCEAFRYWTDPAAKADAELCGEPPAGTITSACPHEHVNRRPVCAGCAVDIQHGSLPDYPWLCQHCQDSPISPHDCVPLVQIEWSSGERTIVQSPMEVAR